MSDNRIENEIKKHAGEIFGQEISLPTGHRERFEQRLRGLNGTEATNEDVTEIPDDNKDAAIVAYNQRKVVPLRKIITAIAIAAVFAGFGIINNIQIDDSQSTELAEVLSYYSLLLEEQIDATKQLVQNIDEEGRRESLLENIERINSPIPDVQMPDDEYIILIANVYTSKIESLQDLQNILKDNI
jgi:hypothetical protein